MYVWLNNARLPLSVDAMLTSSTVIFAPMKVKLMELVFVFQSTVDEVRHFIVIIIGL